MHGRGRRRCSRRRRGRPDPAPARRIRRRRRALAPGRSPAPSPDPLAPALGPPGCREGWCRREGWGRGRRIRNVLVLRPRHCSCRVGPPRRRRSTGRGAPRAGGRARGRGALPPRRPPRPHPLEERATLPAPPWEREMDGDAASREREREKGERSTRERESVATREREGVRVCYIVLSVTRLNWASIWASPLTEAVVLRLAASIHRSISRSG